MLHATAGSNNQLYEAAVEVTTLVRKHDIEAIAIGNGTGSRETEAFIKKLKLPAAIPVVMVNESGASIYSASDVAREEFPHEDVTVRGAVSIGRRLMDPLAELVNSIPNPSASANTSTMWIRARLRRISMTPWFPASTP